MNRRTSRWLLAPIRQGRTLRLVQQHGPSLPYETAWALITLHTSPDETDLVRAWARENPGGPPGIHRDNWRHLPYKEQQRRKGWLRRHGHSPVQLLRVEASLVMSAGLHVLDWGLPPPTRSSALRPATAPVS